MTSEVTNAAHAIIELEREGATLVVTPAGKIRLTNPAGLEPRHLDTLRRHKLEALQYLEERERRGLPPDDPYSIRLHQALMTMCGPDYPHGLVPWLGAGHPNLYVALTETFPDEIHRLWSAGAPVTEFDEVLAGMLATQREAIALYRAAELSPKAW